MGTGNRTDFDSRAFGPFAPLYEAYVTALEDFGHSFGLPTAPLRR